MIAIKTIPAMTRFIHTSNGIRLIFIPGHRRHRIVAMILIAVPMLPNPETSRERVQ